jgi:Ni/Co efflux regulator RcnB
MEPGTSPISAEIEPLLAPEVVVKRTWLTALALIAVLAIGPAAARDKGHDKGKHGSHAEDQGRGNHFGDRDRAAIRDYYVDAGRGGHCPPGLAKKNNGCLPPGQAKKWQMGQPLPAGVVYESLPPALIVQLTPPPSGYRYVRVAGDILMISAGTRMVIDAIQDLGR